MLALAPLLASLGGVAIHQNAVLLFGHPREASATETERVVVPLTALDEHDQPVLDLHKEDIHVIEHKRECEVESLVSRASQPLSVGLLIDVSNSQRGRRPPGYEHTISMFLRKSLANNGMAFVAAFNDKQYLVADLTRDISKLHAAVHSALSSSSGGTALYDAIYVAFHNEPSTSNSRNVLVVFSDFLDNASEHTREEAVQSALRSHTIIFPVAFGQVAQRGLAAAKALAIETGGSYFSVDSNAALEKIASSMAGLYDLTVSPVPASRHRVFHRVKIECDREGVKVIAPAAYYTP